MTADELMYEAGLLYNGLEPRHRPAARKAINKLEQEKAAIEREEGELAAKCRKAIRWMEKRQADHDEVAR